MSVSVCVCVRYGSPFPPNELKFYTLYRFGRLFVRFGVTDDAIQSNLYKNWTQSNVMINRKISTASDATSIKLIKSKMMIN